MEEGLMNRG